MLSAIEAELQLPLLKRTRTGARLTPEGEQMMPYIHEIVRQESCCGRRRNACIRSLLARSASARSPASPRTGCPP
ncbi:MAG: hypothetical protein ACLU3I_18915 [Acutalibacteraceae bacterium]